METYFLLKYLKRATSPKEEAEVRQWLADDPDGSHLEEYKALHNIYNGMVLYQDDKAVAAARERKKSIVRIVALAAVSAAAVFAGLLIGVGRSVRNNTIDTLSAQMETVSVPAGKNLQVTLPDGTKVWLNAGTTICYPRVTPRKSRYVKVDNGEVLFDVKKDENKPFVVETFASRITVLGTRFNVMADEQRNEFSVVLLRGSIKAENTILPGEEVLMKPNQRLSLKDNHFAMNAVENESAVDCWTEGLIDVTDVAFNELMRKFEKAFNIRIVIDREELPVISYTRGKVRVSDGIDHAMEVLELASDFSYTRNYETNTLVIK